MYLNNISILTIFKIIGKIGAAIIMWWIIIQVFGLLLFLTIGLLTS